MPYARPHERAIILRFIMDAVGAITFAKRANGALRADRLVILCAIGLSSLQSRPMRPNKIAAFLGLPRTSLLRRLEELEADGWIERLENGRILINAERLNAPEIQGICDRLSTVIHRASSDLLAIEQKENKTDQNGH